MIALGTCFTGLMADKDNLSDGELEDGEVLSSEEEEEGPGNPKVCAYR